MPSIRVLGILVALRSEAAIKVQEVLTKYGCSVRTRLGLNIPDDSGSGEQGLIILDLFGDPDESIRLENELRSLDRVKVQRMEFNN
ncbi:MAG: hypothetical protein ACLFS0_00560 [Bacteroidales bacterium]